MKKIVLTYGIIGGIIVTTMMWLTIGSENHDWDNALLIGYTTMVIALAPIFFAVRNYRDKHLDGTITFGKAFLMGLYITLVVSTLYVASWLLLTATSDRDYMAEYYVHYEAELKSSDRPAAEVEAELKKFREASENYKNPIVKIGYTYSEILPVGLLISLICATILKRKTSAAARMVMLALLLAGAAPTALAQATPTTQQNTTMDRTTPRVTGIGGIFFVSEDPAKTHAWYGEHLGLAIDAYGSPFEFRNADRPEEINYLRWSAFAKGTDYMDPSKSPFMINYRVQNLEALVVQLKAKGVNVLDEIATYDYGKFVHLIDVDGSKVELWEPIDSFFTQLGGATTK